jgi:hypothetical protein
MNQAFDAVAFASTTAMGMSTFLYLEKYSITPPESLNNTCPLLPVHFASIIEISQAMVGLTLITRKGSTPSKSHFL